jgi:antirestriction protein ArdC
MANVANKVDVYELVTNRILEQMEKGICPWQKPWHGGLEGAISYTTGRPYSLLNQFLLGKEGEYLTFKQVQTLGGKVKKGAKAQMVVFFKQYPISEEVLNDKGEKETKTHFIPLLRYYMVFHIDDCEGIQSKLGDKPVCTLSPVESAEKVVNDYFSRESCKLNVKLSDKAYYCPSTDEVVVPQLDQYDSADEYYSTTLHEMTHSTGHSSRLNRDLGNFFGSDPYAKEELIAEIGAAFLTNKCGLDSEKAFKNSVAYLQSWSKRFKQDKRLIVSAAGKAQKAVEFILNGKPE